MSIKPEYYTLDNLLAKRLFRIPNYQRAYSWTRKQREDLFQDILKIHNCGDKKRHHFMATTVCLNTSTSEEIGTDEFEVVDVVDGQQRITTLITLLKALSKYLSEGNEIDRKEAEDIEKLLVKGDRRLILLQTNHDSSNIFRDYLTKGEIPERKNVKTTAEFNLHNAFIDCENFVKKWAEETADAVQLLKIVKNRLDFIFYVLNDEGAVYTVFEVLNSRGLDVDWLDKCKSMLMGILFEKFNKEIAKEHIEEVHKLWSHVYRAIGISNIPGDQILRFTATLKHNQYKSRTVSPEEAVEFFREYCLKHPHKVVEVTNWILKVTETLDILYKNKKLKAVTEIHHARLLAVAILLSEKLNEQERNLAIEQWERVTFRIFGLHRKDSRSAIGDYTRLAHKIIKDGFGYNLIMNELKKIGSWYKIDDAIHNLKEENWYEGWENELRYFFYKYEKHLAKQAGTEIDESNWDNIWESPAIHSIEHILPKAYFNDSSWNKKFEDPWEAMNKLANLTLLQPRLNSKAGYKSFTNKKKIYEDSYLRIMKDIIVFDDWNDESLLKREAQLIEWVKKEWSDI